MKNKKFVPKKSLGQNFLQDKKVLQQIIAGGEIKKQDNILEIGPGEGVLTELILEKLHNRGRLLVIEKDNRLKKADSNLMKLKRVNDNLKVYFEDILAINLEEILKANNFLSNSYKVIANIPYYITGRIIRILFQQKKFPKLVVLLVQKEVAERICALNGKQSILSLSVQYYAQAKLIAYVPRTAFQPMPKVDSAIVRFQPFKSQPSLEDKKFFQLVKIGFSAPRKTLFNNLKNGFQFQKSDLEKIFSQLKLELKIRAEDLSLEQWKKIFLNLK